MTQNGTTENHYRYTGEQYDADLDNYYLRARYYNQGIGRFSQMDTYQGRMGEPLTLHKYMYSHADPVNNIDPTGMFTIKQTMVAVAASGILISASHQNQFNSAAGFGFSGNRSNVGVILSSDRIKTFFASIGVGPMLNRSHPTHWEEKEALNMTGAESCEELAWAIDILTRGIKWRKGDLERNPQGANNIIGKGHKDRIKIMTDKLKQLEQIFLDKGC